MYVLGHMISAYAYVYPARLRNLLIFRQNPMHGRPDSQIPRLPLPFPPSPTMPLPPTALAGELVFLVKSTSIYNPGMYDTVIRRHLERGAEVGGGEQVEGRLGQCGEDMIL